MVLTIYFKVYANSARDMVNQIELYHYNIVMNDLRNYQRVIKKGPICLVNMCATFGELIIS